MSEKFDDKLETVKNNSVLITIKQYFGIEDED